MFDHDDGHGGKVLAINEGKQAVNQLIASVLTFVIAITGGGLTGNFHNRTKRGTSMRNIIGNQYTLLNYENVHINYQGCY